MKIAVLGAGAMGGLFASYLSQKNDVTLVSHHAEQADLINKNGFTVLEKDGTKQVFHPHAVTSTKGMQPVDLVILFVKSMANESVLAANRSLLGPDTYLCTLQNGSGHENVLKKFVSEDHIVLGTTQHNASTEARNITRHGGSGMTHLGCVTGDASRLQKFADCFILRSCCRCLRQGAGDDLEQDVHEHLRKCPDRRPAGAFGIHRERPVCLVPLLSAHR